MTKAKIKVNMEDFYNGFMEAARRKDNKLGEFEIEGDLIEDGYKYSIGDTVFVNHYYDTTSYGWKDYPKILGGRWGKITHTNANSPKKHEEGIRYYVEGKKYAGIGGWEKEENIEIINQ